MAKKRVRRKLKKGLPPGSLVYTGYRTERTPVVFSSWYNADRYELFEKYEPVKTAHPDGVAWIDIRSLHDTDLIEKIGNDYKVHQLALEDVLNTQQRAKLEDYDDHLFFVLHNLQVDHNTLELVTEQISIYAGEHFVISFQEDPDDTLESVRHRAKEGVSRLRKKGSDYLVYTIVDTIIDNYYIALDVVDNALQELEQELHTNGASSECKAGIYRLKRLIYQLNHRLRPLRDALNRFYHFESSWLDNSNRIFYRDLADHVAQMLDNLDNFRDLISGAEAFYQAEISNRLNNVMRLLTVISTIFIPLTLIAGIYGMNFDNMPELHWHYGYFYVLAGMGTLMLVMLVYFKVKKWI